MKIPGWSEEEQKKIFNRKVLVVGDDILGEMVVAGLVSFGSRNIFYEDYRNTASSKSYFSNISGSGTRLEKIVRTVAKINPYARIYGYKAPFTKLYPNIEGFTPEIVIDATNNPESKETVLDYLEKNKGTKFISGISNPTACAVSFYDPIVGNYEDILHPKITAEMYHQGGFISTIAAGLIIEEFRKSIFRLEETDKNTKNTIYYNLNSSSRNSPENDSSFSIENLVKSAKILIAGCGGIGTYVGMGLAQEGFKKLSFLDMDFIEDTNLNRQMLFYDDIGERKNISLSKKLNDAYGLNYELLSGKLDDKSKDIFRGVDLDMIFGCFDNANARVFLNDCAVRYGISYIDGGVTYSDGEIRLYVPGKTACVKCKKGMRITEEVSSASCDDAAPSVISPNMIIGSMMVGEFMRISSGHYQDLKISYDTFVDNKINVYSEEIQKCSCGS
jgi:molybdopterin/thiamine biosynthesis adenylyltransferase